MSTRFVLRFVFGLLAAGLADLAAQAPSSTPDIDNPTGNTGALKAQVPTAGSYDAHSGNATRIVNDLHVPGALGVYGLDFTRYWNSLQMNYEDNATGFVEPDGFGASTFSHSWQWNANYDYIYPGEIPGSDANDNKYTTALNITFPDGHTAQFKIVRLRTDDWMVEGQWPWWGPPYSVNELDLLSRGGMGVHDHICNMNAQSGTDFSLCLADGGSVHFVNMMATEVFDPHGLRTELRYDPQGHLTDVIQDGGRFLKITWGYFSGGGFVVTQVQAGTGPNGAGLNRKVTYEYVHMDGSPGNSGSTSALVLQHVAYPDEPAPGQTVRSTYSYGTCWGDEAEPCVYPAGSSTPLLKRADDPHFTGPMTVIRYSYRGVRCPKLTLQPWTHPDYMRAQPYAIAAEKSDSGIAVSTFEIDCDGGQRREYDGLGGWRIFYFGGSAGLNAVQGGTCRGFQLGKLTDFTEDGAVPPNAPSQQQNFIFGDLLNVWDGRGLWTQAMANAQDDSGEPAEIHRPDGSVDYYNRVTPSAGSATLDPNQGMHNPYNHWVFSETHQLNGTTNHITTYTRDSRRRVTRIDYSGGWSESFTYNPFNQLVTHTLPSLAIVTYVYDARGLLTSEYNSVDGAASATTYTYYSSTNHPEWTDQIATVKNPRALASGKAYSTMMKYNGRQQVTEVHYPAMGGGADPSVKYSYDGNGNCTSITNELLDRSTYTYDLYRRCISYTEPLNAPDWNGAGTVASRTWNWSYDRYIPGVGSKGSSTHTGKDWRTQIEPVFNSAGYRRGSGRWEDAENRVIHEETGWVVLGNVWSKSADWEGHDFSYDENGQKETATDPLGRVTTYTYDNRNRLYQTIEPKRADQSTNPTTAILYDMAGNKTKVTLPDTKTQQWLNYDAFGQAGQFIDERNDNTDLVYWWGPMKKLRTVTTYRDKDAGGTESQLTTFTYNGIGRLVQTVFPDGTHEDSTFQCITGSSYNCDQPDTWTNRDRKKKTIIYDARGRELSCSWKDAVTGALDSTPGVNRTWDDANRLSRISNLHSIIDYTYDDAGQVGTEKNTVTGASGQKQISYFRYPSGEAAHVIYPNGWRSRRDYTSRGQLAATGNDGATGVWSAKLAEYVYLDDGKVQTETNFNGVQTAYDYDGRGQISGTNTQLLSPAKRYSYRTYFRDTRDRIYAWTKSNSPTYNILENGRGDRYTYDPEGQLTAASYEALTPNTTPTGAQRAESFVYDAMGNRKGSNVVAGRGAVTFSRRDNGLNQYASWTPSVIYCDDNSPWAPWGPDGNGVMMAEGTITASYNALNQPIAIWSHAYDSTSNYMWFGFDPLGRCVKRWSRPDWDAAEHYPATYFYYDGWNLVQEDSGGASAGRLYVNGNRVDEIVADYNYASPQWRFHHYDARGHCILLTNISGTLIEQYGYDAFGKPYFYDANGTLLANGSAAAIGNRFLFTGREWLSDLKLYDFRNRVYQPELGRFMQPDPKEFTAGDYNLYRYCHNDPVNKSDPTGLRVAADVERGEERIPSSQGSP